MKLQNIVAPTNRFILFEQIKSNLWRKAAFSWKEKIATINDKEPRKKTKNIEKSFIEMFNIINPKDKKKYFCGKDNKQLNRKGSKN